MFPPISRSVRGLVSPEKTISSALEKGGRGLCFEKGEIASCLKQAGFNRVDARMIELPAGESELVVAR